jgi:hypothetical protein
MRAPSDAQYEWCRVELRAGADGLFESARSYGGACGARTQPPSARSRTCSPAKGELGVSSPIVDLLPRLVWLSSPLRKHYCMGGLAK